MERREVKRIGQPLRDLSCKSQWELSTGRRTPCLTANDGKPCFDLAVGMTSFDVKKYELLIETTTKWIKASKEYGREDMVKANEKNLERYQNIYETIKARNVIFGRFDRMKRQLERKKKEGVKRG